MHVFWTPYGLLGLFVDLTICLGCELLGGRIRRVALSLLLQWLHEGIYSVFYSIFFTSAYRIYSMRTYRMRGKGFCDSPTVLIHAHCNMISCLSQHLSCFLVLLLLCGLKLRATMGTLPHTIDHHPVQLYYMLAKELWQQWILKWQLECIYSTSINHSYPP